MAEGGLIASNGQKSNLTLEQYRLVRTPEFKAWFGDWENNPKNASKVVDENGEPMVVYHGGDVDFNVFDVNKTTNKRFHFTPSKEYAEFRGQISKPYFLKIIELNYVDWQQRRTLPKPKGKFSGYANLLNSIKNLKEIVVFEPNQIKLADGTNTTFDIDNQDIRYKDGGKLFNDKELLAKWKKGESIGFTGEAHLKAKGLIPRADGTKRKSEKYMANGGQTSQEVVCHNCSWHWNTTDSDEYDKYVCHKCGFDNTLFYSNNIMEKGGEVNADNPKIKNEMIHKSGKVGGLLVGKRHSEGGIKAINKSNNSPLEMEGGEVVITRNAVSDDTKREFEGEMLTNRQILSKINEGGGGVSFADGGDIPTHIMVSGKEYKYGGNTMKDNEIVDYCGCKHKMAEGGDLKLFGIKHLDLKPSEAFEKLFGHKYKNGGSVESIMIIDKSVPSYTDFKNNNKNTNLHTSKSEYKKYLKNNYKVDFDLLPHRIQMALFLGNQKLVDNYINS
jgi:hypothetical protein